MKKSFSKRIVVLLMVLVMAGGAMFAATTADIVLSGTIAPELSLALAELSGTTGTTTLELAGTGAVDLDVATLTYISNDTDGFTLSMYTANAGLLTSTLGDTIAYDLEFVDSVSSTVVDLNVDTATDVAMHDFYNVDRLTDPAGDAGTISVQYTKGNYPAGTYTDTVYFQIAAN